MNPEATDVPGPLTKLRVMLSKARDLPAVDKSRFSRASSDPVCRLGIVGSGVRKVPKKKGHTSSIKMKNLNPTWEETFDLPAHDAVDGPSCSWWSRTTTRWATTTSWAS